MFLLQGYGEVVLQPEPLPSSDVYQNGLHMQSLPAYVNMLHFPGLASGVHPLTLKASFWLPSRDSTPALLMSDLAAHALIQKVDSLTAFQVLRAWHPAGPCPAVAT